MDYMGLVLPALITVFSGLPNRNRSRQGTLTMLKQLVLLTSLLAGGAVLAAEKATPPAEPMPAAEAAPEAEPAPAPESMPAPGEVARAQFTTMVIDREPVDEVSSVASDIGTVYFFTDLRDFDGQIVVHVWLHNGEVMAEVPFDVGGPRWRVWSSKDLVAAWTGDWTVYVVTADGSVVAKHKLKVTAPAPAAEPMPAEEPAPMTEPATEPMSAEEPASEPPAQG